MKAPLEEKQEGHSNEHQHFLILLSPASNRRDTEQMCPISV